VSVSPAAAWSRVAEEYARYILPDFVPAARTLCAYLEVGPADRVVDVACGPGTAALVAAELGAREVIGVDFAPDMLRVAGQRAESAGVAARVRFLEGDATALPLDDMSAEVALSSFGVVFAPDPEGAVAELARVLVPHGRLGMTAWPRDRGVGQYYARIYRHLPAPQGHDSHRWGDPAQARAWLEPHFELLLAQTIDVPLDAPSPADAWQRLRSSGRVSAGYAALDAAARDAMDRDLHAFFAEHADGSGRVRWPREALVLCARRRS
jgi:ubiquinone/menaquinone biosynthesis C-methylase UbiE